MNSGFLKIFTNVIFFIITLFLFSNPVLASNKKRFIVGFREDFPEINRKLLIKNIRANAVDKIKKDNSVVVEIEERDLGLLPYLTKNLGVLYVEEDAKVFAFEIPNDPLYQDQWGLSKIQADLAWEVSHGSSSADIAIVDTGINGSHPDLALKLKASVDCTVSYTCPPSLPVDFNGHGTHVAGIASAVTNNSIGVAGLAWEGSLVSVKALDDNGSGYYSWVSNAIYWAADNGVKVINLSLGGNSPSKTLERAINYAWDKGVVIVAAAGNNGSAKKTYPAYYKNAIAVAATNSDDKKAWFSNYGLWVDVAAPGENIISTYKDGYEKLSGTSMSTPFVSGLAALLYGFDPSLGAGGIRQRIENTADRISGTGRYWVFGRINACKALGGCH